MPNQIIDRYGTLEFKLQVLLPLTPEEKCGAAMPDFQFILSQGHVPLG